MTEVMPGTIKDKGIDGSTLKIVAIVCMVIDHFAMVFIKESATQEPFLRVLYYIMRAMGRLAFPLMLFLLTVGLVHTGNVLKYIARIMLFAFISEIPYNLGLYGKLWYPSQQNVLFTLAVCLAVTALIKKVFESEKYDTAWKWGLTVIITCAGAAVSQVLHFDGGWAGVAAAVLMFIFRDKKTAGYCAGAAALTVANLFEIFTFLGVPLIALYNGKRGKIGKYFFYIFYPVHLILLWIVKLLFT